MSAKECRGVECKTILTWPRIGCQSWKIKTSSRSADKCNMAALVVWTSSGLLINFIRTVHMPANKYECFLEWIHVCWNKISFVRRTARRSMEEFLSHGSEQRRPAWKTWTHRATINRWTSNFKAIKRVILKSLQHLTCIPVSANYNFFRAFFPRQPHVFRIMWRTHKHVNVHTRLTHAEEIALELLQGNVSVTFEMITTIVILLHLKWLQLL